MAEANNNQPSTQTVEKKDPSPEKPKRRWCCLVVPLVLIVLIVAVVFIARYIYRTETSNYSAEKVPARGYSYPAPSNEALNRKLSCDDFREYKLNPDKYRPLCLNLFSATADQINQANSGGQYNVVLLYGQYTTWRLYLPARIRNVDNVGESFLRVAKFNDLITIPKMMDWYSLTSLDYIPKELSPYPALAFSFADQDKIKELCNAYVAGCAKLNFEVVIKDVFLAENKVVGHLAEKPNGDALDWDEKLPVDCYAITTITHEVAHAFLVANKISVSGMNTSGWLNAPSYFNENMTEIFTTKFSDDVCGPGSIAINKMTIGGQPASGDIITFNAAFPPYALHPTSFPKDDQCEQALISSFSHYLQKGDFKSQYKNFVVAFRAAMKQKDFGAYKDNKLMTSFMLKMLGNDPTEKEFLTSHSCSI